MPEVMEFYRMAGDVDYMLRVVVADMASYDVFYKKLIGAVPLKNVTSSFSVEKIQWVAGCAVPAAEGADVYQERRALHRCAPLSRLRGRAGVIGARLGER